jgi:hypothetical protein
VYAFWDFDSIQTAPFLIPAPKAENATPNGAAFLLSCAGHWPPKSCGRRWFFHRAYCKLSLPVIPFSRAALLADALAGRLLSLGWPDISPAAGTSLAL